MATLAELEDWYARYYQPQPQNRLSDLAQIDPAQLAAMQQDNAMGGDVGVSYVQPPMQQSIPQQMPENYIQRTGGQPIALQSIQQQGGMSLNDLLNRTGARIQDKVILSDRGEGYRTPYGSVVGLDSQGRMWEQGKPVAQKPTVKQMKEYFDMMKSKAEAEDAAGIVGMTAGQASQKFLERRYGKAPEGQRWTNEGALEMVPGGKAEQVQQKERMRSEQAVTQAETVQSKIAEALPKVSNWTAGVGSYLANIPATPARDLQGTIDTIKANIGFRELQAMREASPTGGALGQVAVKELEFLQAALSSLDQAQSPERLKQNLNQVNRHFDNWKKIMRGQYGQEFGSQVQQPAQQQQGNTMNIGGANYEVIQTNPNGSIRIRDPQTGRTGTVRP